MGSTRCTRRVSRPRCGAQTAVPLGRLFLCRKTRRWLRPIRPHHDISTLAHTTGNESVCGPASTTVPRGKPASRARRSPAIGVGLGSKSTYDTIHNNPDISNQAVDTTNPPHLIIQNDRLTTINNSTRMDLQGQAASDRTGTATSAAAEANCSSSAVPMPPRAGSRSSACPRRTSATGIGEAVSC